MKITTFLTQNIALQISRLILWIPIFIGLGAYFAILFFANLTMAKIIFALAIFLFSLFLYFSNKESYKSLFYAAVAAFLFGCVYTFFYQKFANNYNQITGKIFVDVKAKVADVNKFSSSVTHHQGLNLLLEEVELYKSQFNYNKPKKPKREVEISEKYIIKNFMNLDGFQEIDRKFLNALANYQEVKWVTKNGREAYAKPPRKISVIYQRANEDLKIGDEIYFRASLMPFKEKQFVSDFDFAFNAKSKQIGAQGYVSGEIVVLKKAQISSFDEFVSQLRQKIQNIILSDLKGDQGTIAAALLMGNQSLISKEKMQEMRNSGLVHLISISGLHLSLAAAIFFVSFRFLLSRFEYIALNFDIKKIAAIIAIFSSYFYLEIAGAPVPAQRSFIAVLLVMLAIIFDKKIDALRSLLFAALALILFNPYNIFSISFQLSFAAMFALALAAEFSQILKNNNFFSYKNNKNDDEKNANNSQKKSNIFTIKSKKILLYFIEMVVVSSLAQLATAPFIIYYFGDVSIYGALSNLVAIPLTSFTTMPLGFLSFFLMPFGLEKIALVPMGLTIDWVIEIAKFVSNLNYSHFFVSQIPKIGVAFAVFGGFIFCFFVGKLRWLGALIFLASFATIIFVKQPDFIVDSQGKFFAIYSKKNGLVFSKNLRPSKKRDLLMQKLNEKEFKSFDNFSSESLSLAGIDCGAEMCKINYQNKKLLFILKRLEIAKICEENFDAIVNLTAKYALPSCALTKNKIIIDNIDLLKNGGYFLYFDDKKIVARSARG